MNKYLLKGVIFISLTGIFMQCSKPIPGDGKQEIINADKAFSALSKEKGMKHAFLHFAAEDVVILRANSYPQLGKTAMEARFGTFSDTGFILTWEPQFADIAASGELGYSYGIYTSTTKDAEGNPNFEKGTYITIWIKDKDGIWKFVLDTGNEGLGEQQ